MKLTVLVDNNTFIDKYLTGEPGVSYLIECDGKKILFDVGYSDVFLKNAQTLQIDLTNIDAIVISHGHNDHTWGLNHLIQYYDRAIKPPEKKINLISHPAALAPKYYESKPIGMNIRQDENDFFFEKVCTKEPLKLSEHVIFLGQIPRINSFEAKKPVGQIHDSDGKLTDDYVLDDSALAIKTKQGLVIITGCSHAGICNIIEHAKLVTGENNITSVIGGFHLLNADEEILHETSKYLNSLSTDSLYPCHCTDLAAKIHLSSHVKIKEVGVGLTLDFPV
ncbi:MBL fold metallo-hydrolase [Brenneria populi subsp. brevivirga]|uniref:MBL fold metallo-hydrolase n=1 Tax=Brenneria populi TaxID=1505588 RepID=UPI002E19DE15|nr:MBL fold metallo-hydrolase [Brenneria populi subsp. brevivirga]